MLSNAKYIPVQAESTFISSIRICHFGENVWCRFARELRFSVVSKSDGRQVPYHSWKGSIIFDIGSNDQRPPREMEGFEKPWHTFNQTDARNHPASYNQSGIYSPWIWIRYEPHLTCNAESLQFVTLRHVWWNLSPCTTLLLSWPSIHVCTIVHVQMYICIEAHATTKY